MELMKELETKFNLLKKELKFKSSFSDIDEVFSLKNFILREGHVAEDFSKQICYMVYDFYNMWTGYLHGLIMPNPSSMINITEHNVLDEEDKAKIIEVMNGTLYIVSLYTLVINLKGNNSDKVKLIDTSVSFWNNEFSQKLSQPLGKIHNNWKEKSPI
jgi:hypothetical protein